MLYMPFPYSVPLPAINSPTPGKEVGKGKWEKMRKWKMERIWEGMEQDWDFWIQVKKMLKQGVNNQPTASMLCMFGIRWMHIRFDKGEVFGHTDSGYFSGVVG